MEAFKSLVKQKNEMNRFEDVAYKRNRVRSLKLTNQTSKSYQNISVREQTRIKH